MNDEKSIRVLIVEDHHVVRRGLHMLLSHEPGIEPVGEAADGIEAVQMARSIQPDVILMDLVMPRKDGLEAIIEIMQENPDARILVLTSFAEDDQVIPAIKAGALGYFLKASSPEELLEAIRNVYRGVPSLHPTITRKMFLELKQPPDPPPAKKPLTERETMVLRLVAQGLTNQEIADKLTISEWTVRGHVRNLMGKLNLSNRTQAALYALREGLADL